MWGLGVTSSQFASAVAAGLWGRSRRFVGVCLMGGAAGGWSVGSEGSPGAAVMPGGGVRRWSVAWVGGRTRAGRLGLVGGLLVCAVVGSLAAPGVADRDVASGRQNARRGVEAVPLAARGPVSEALGRDDRAYSVRGRR